MFFQRSSVYLRWPPTPFLCILVNLIRPSRHLWSSLPIVLLALRTRIDKGQRFTFRARGGVDRLESGKRGRDRRTTQKPFRRGDGVRLLVIRLLAQGKCSRKPEQVKEQTGPPTQDFNLLAPLRTVVLVPHVSFHSPCDILFALP